MAVLPAEVSNAWDDREGRAVFTTVDGEGIPNAIYANCVRKYGKDTLVVADNYFYKTRANILAGSPGSLLFITKAGKSYQIKGTVEYHIEGEVFDDMKNWNPPHRSGHAAAAIIVEQVYSGEVRLI